MGVIKSFPAYEGLRFWEENGGYVAWSGGKDSTVVAVEMNRICPEIPVVWFDSGLEFPETRQFIDDTADFFRFNLHVVYPEVDALTLLRESGLWEYSDGREAGEENFPVVDLHDVLIDAPVRVAHEMFGRGEILGLRAAESKNRRIQLSKTKGRWGGTWETWCPIWDWRDAHVDSYYVFNDVPLNPVYTKMERLGVPFADRRVGLIVDGNGMFWGGRGAVLRQGWPEVWNELVQVLPRLKEWR